MTPIELIARKQKVGKEDADAIALQVMIHMDAAKRSQCTNAGANFLTKHLIIASYIAAKAKSKRFHDQVTKAYAALEKASARETKLLDLTTGEHKTLAVALRTYLCTLPNVEVGTMADACLVAQKMLE